MGTHWSGGFEMDSELKALMEVERLRRRVEELEAKLAAYEPDALYDECQRLRMMLAEKDAENQQAMMLAAKFVPDNRGRQ